MKNEKEPESFNNLVFIRNFSGKLTSPGEKSRLIRYSRTLRIELTVRPARNEQPTPLFRLLFPVFTGCHAGLAFKDGVKSSL